MVNVVLSFGMEHFITQVHVSFCSRIYKRLADVELRTTLISLGKRGTLENLQIDALFQIVTKKSHSEVLMNRSSSELRQGLILVIQQRTFLSFSKVFLQFRLNLVDRRVSWRKHCLASESFRHMFRRRPYGKPSHAVQVCLRIYIIGFLSRKRTAFSDDYRRRDELWRLVMNQCIFFQHIQAIILSM